MKDYLSYSFVDSESFVSTFDELPLWSAPFGLLLLKHLKLQADLKVLDVGSGAGFPLLELSARLGDSCKLYGLDVWTNANNRAKHKIENYKLHNVQIVEGSATNIPFEDHFFNLITSNLGVNNFENPDTVFKECHRVLKVHGKLAITSNIKGHWKELYEIFYLSLTQINKEHLIPVLKKDEEHRGTKESISQSFSNNGFTVIRFYEELFEMNFLNGTAFLNHPFIKLGWLSTWLTIFPPSDHLEIFTKLEENLNDYAHQHEGLNLSMPMIFIEGEKK